MNDTFLRSVKDIKKSLVKTGFLRGGQFLSYGPKYFCDCSSLVTSILKIENKALYTKISKGKENLKSYEYFDYAMSENCFVKNIDKILTGDILCWKKDHIPKSGDTGHMSIVLSSPVKDSHNFFRVRVFDSSKTPHTSDSCFIDGVGERDLLLQTNDQLEIIGVKWSDKVDKVKRTDIISIRFLDI